MIRRASENFVYSGLLNLIGSHKPCVLAVVTRTKGSTPQKQGSMAIFRKNELWAGTIGGGVTEMKVGALAKDALKRNKNEYHVFDLDHNIVDEAEAICGGTMEIFLDVSPGKDSEIFMALMNSVTDRTPGVLLTIIEKSQTEVSSIKRFWLNKQNIDKYRQSLGKHVAQKVSAALEDPLRNEFHELKTQGKGKEEVILLETIVPRPQLLIAGAGHIGKALSHLGSLLDFETIVLDDREKYANKENLPDALYIFRDSPEEVMQKIKVDRSTYVVIVTQGHKRDADVLRAVIKKQLAYIGMIGSKIKIARMRELFMEREWATKEQWDGIYAPVGIDIHSTTVQEIAISIAAQLIQVRNKQINEQ